MPFKYNKVLIIGATSGIGLAYAEKVVAEGKRVIIVGRRKENLDAFVRQHGYNADAIVFDITKLEQIPSFVQQVTSNHPDLDSVIINSGIQRGFDFAKPQTVNLATVDLEFTTNYIAYVHLTKALIPFLQKQGDKETALIYTSSALALMPAVKQLNYSATKAALHHFILALREQMKEGPGNIKIIEIFPPAVQTELHDHQPDIKNGRQIGMPLGEFTEQSWAKLLEGEEQITVGFAAIIFDKFEKSKQEAFQGMVKAMKQGD